VSEIPDWLVAVALALLGRLAIQGLTVRDVAAAVA